MKEPIKGIPHSSDTLPRLLRLFKRANTDCKCTSAHAIVESWEEQEAYHEVQDKKEHNYNDGYLSQLSSSSSHLGGLFVLSATSAQALAKKAAALATYLREHLDTHLGRLARTLFQRADVLSGFRVAFSATSAAQLANKLEKSAASSAVKTPRIAANPRILGVFTGQGAQWATMGRELYSASSVFRASLDRCQRSLDTLLEADCPAWRLVDELSAPPETSPLASATVAQPLCTALQVGFFHAFFYLFNSLARCLRNSLRSNLERRDQEPDKETVLSLDTILPLLRPLESECTD